MVDGRARGRAGLPKSTASRLLRALERHELVQRDRPTARCGPGSVLVQYARARRRQPRSRRARPARRSIALAEQSSETVNLAVPSGDGVETVAQVDSGYMLGATTGSAVSSRCTPPRSARCSSPRALRLPPDGSRRPRPRTIVDHDALQRDLALVRQRGYATSVEELEPGLLAVAARVRERSGA